LLGGEAFAVLSVPEPGSLTLLGIGLLGLLAFGGSCSTWSSRYSGRSRPNGSGIARSPSIISADEPSTCP
ncbi:MAG TPA: PEP-CTERM sorting domain-containing protein, partial [Isosphaeraceae bacterium]|nr:PEP-CTERM sorting domain-containing protein [Isosphaeraceae bacterium]